MRKVKINYFSKKAGEVSEIASNVSGNLYSVGSFPTPPVTKVDLDAQNDKVVAAISAAANRDREKLAELRNEKEILCGMLRQLADYVNTVVQDGDEHKLLSSGFEITKSPVKNQLPTVITRIEAKFTNRTGMIDLLWRGSRNARYFSVFMSADNGQTWTMLDTVFGRKMMVQQLSSGTRYQFKVVPVGLHGEGPVSDIATQVAA